MREGIKRTPVELLRAAIEEQRCEMPCGTLHELHGDERNICDSRGCEECKLGALRKAADLVEAELDALKARALPEGMEWPTVDGKPVVIGERLVGYGSGDDGYEVVGVRPTCGWVLVKSCDHIHRDGGPVILEWDASKCHRPAPKVLDADGVEIRVGDTVYYVDGREQKVNTVARLTDSGRVQFGTINEAGYVTYCEAACISPNQLTHERPVLDADGVPIHEGDTVYVLGFGEPLTVKGFADDGRVLMSFHDDNSLGYKPSKLTHEQPDSWERIEEDCAKFCIEYCDEHGLLDHGCNAAEGDASTRHCTDCGDSCEERMARDLVRRARALAERGGR